MTVQDVSYRRLADKAMTGDQKAFNYLLTLANNVDPPISTRRPRVSRRSRISRSSPTTSGGINRGAAQNETSETSSRRTCCELPRRPTRPHKDAYWTRSRAGILPPSSIAVSRHLSPGAQFEPNWHIEAMAYHLEQVRLGKIKRLIINMPPRSLKSIVSSVAFPAYFLGHDPTKRLICVSYGSDLATKHANDCRSIMKSAWYRKLFPQTVISSLKDTER